MECAAERDESAALAGAEAGSAGSAASAPRRSVAECARFGRYALFSVLLCELLLLPQAGLLTFMVFGGLPRAPCNGSAAATPLFRSAALEFGRPCPTTFGHPMAESVSLQMVGALVGALAFGPLARRLGRRRLLLAAHPAMGLLAFLASGAPNLARFNALQFAATFCAGGSATITHVFLMESLPRSHRFWASSVLTHSPNYILLSALAYYTGNWRSLLRMISALNVPAFFTLLIAFESPTWMIQKGLLQKARFTLQKIELINGTATPQRLQMLSDMIEREFMEQKQPKGRGGSPARRLLQSRTLAATSFALLCTSLLAHATLFRLDLLRGAAARNAALYGLLRGALGLGAGLLARSRPPAARIQRLHSGCAVACVLAGLAALLTSQVTGAERPQLSTLLALTAAAFSSHCQRINAAVVAELLPTAAAAAFAQVFGRLGAILAPHVFLMAWLWDALPPLCLLVLVAVGALLFHAFAPHNQPVPTQWRQPLDAEQSERKLAPPNHL